MPKDVIHKTVLCIISKETPFKDGVPLMKWARPIAVNIEKLRPRLCEEGQNVLIMGRKTWQSLPGAVDGCLNVVISSNIQHLTLPSGVLGFSSFEDAYDVLVCIPTLDKLHMVGGTRLMDAVFKHPTCGKAIFTVTVEAIPKKQSDFDQFGMRSKADMVWPEDGTIFHLAMYAFPTTTTVEPTTTAAIEPTIDESTEEKCVISYFKVMKKCDRKKSTVNDEPTATTTNDEPTATTTNDEPTTTTTTTNDESTTTTTNDETANDEEAEQIVSMIMGFIDYEQSKLPTTADETVLSFARRQFMEVQRILRESTITAHESTTTSDEPTTTADEPTTTATEPTTNAACEREDIGMYLALGLYKEAQRILCGSTIDEPTAVVEQITEKSDSIESNEHPTINESVESEDFEAGVIMVDEPIVRDESNNNAEQ